MPTDGIFISYRRDDGAYPAGWLFDRLASRFGFERVFKDVDSIEPGDDFSEVINNAVGSCAVLLAVIGQGWLHAEGQNGRRLEDPADFVRLEIEVALVRGVKVIPVLVDGAQMPKTEHLPSSLRKLATRQAVELSHTRFDNDLGRIVRVLEKVVEPEAEPADRKPPDVTLQTGDTNAIAAMLSRLESQRGSLVREAYAGLREIGYTMQIPKPRDPNRQPPAYLRFHDPGRPGSAVGYLTPQNISFTLDKEKLKSEPGGRIVPHTGEVAFSHANRAGLAKGLQVARTLKVKEVPRRSPSAANRNPKPRYTNCVVCGWRFKEIGGQTRPNCQVPNACANRVATGWLPGIGDPSNPHNLGGVNVEEAKANQADALKRGMLPAEYVSRLSNSSRE